MVIITAFQAEDDSSILLSRSLLIIDCIKSMSEHCLIKKNTPELRKKLEDAGLSVCICTTFEDADWLSCWGSHMSYDVHGVYPDDVDDLSKEAYLEMYLKETNPIICESDDEFINMCKQIKGK